MNMELIMAYVVPKKNILLISRKIKYILIMTMKMKKPIIHNIVLIDIKVEIKAIQNHFLQNILIETEKVILLKKMMILAI